MEKLAYLSCRITDQQAAKLAKLADRAGLSKGEVIRALVDAADLQPVQTFRPVLKNKTAVFASEGTGGGLAVNP